MFVNYHTEKDLEQYFSAHFKTLLIKSYVEFEENDSYCILERRNNGLIS